jgi:putative transposase
MAGEGLPVQLATGVLGVSESGYYAARIRPASARSIRHAWLLDQIRQVHIASNGTYGARRVHAKLTLGRGLLVGHTAVEMLMARAGIRGVTGRPRWRSPRPDLIATDLVDRDFARTGPNQLWVTDITAPHPGGQGVLRGRAGRLLPPGGGLVNRRLADRGPGHQRAEHVPPAAARRGDPLHRGVQFGS